MKDDITILYIDDKLDSNISKYLHEVMEAEGYKINEKEFSITEDLKSLINSNELKSADIILIDSKLFEEEASEEFYNGEEVRTILRKNYPYKEVFVITQNELNDNIQWIPKYNFQEENSLDFSRITEHYDKYLKQRIASSSDNIREYRYIIGKVHNKKLKKEFEHLNRILNSEIEYEDLNKEDIDRLVNEFKEINKLLNEDK